MFVGIDSFSKGEITSDLVFPDAERKLRHSGGWKIRDGAAIPELLPIRLSTSALGGAIPEQVPFVYRSADGTERIICRDSNNNLRVMPVSGSSAGVWGSALNTVLGMPDGASFRVNKLVVFPTEGADAKLVSFEPDSPATLTRPFSFKGPLDYSADVAPTVTPSSPHPAQTLFTLGASSYFTAAGDGTQLYFKGKSYNMISTDGNVGKSQIIGTLDLGSGGVDLTNGQYLSLDLAMSYVGNDPSTYIASSGMFFNSDQSGVSSGFQLVLFADEACTEELCRFEIPALVGSPVEGARKSAPGTVNRVMFNLGDKSQWALNQTWNTNAGNSPINVIKGIGFSTNGDFSCPSNSRYYLYIYGGSPFDSNGNFISTWKFTSALFLPNVVYQWSPWYDTLPPNQGLSQETYSATSSKSGSGAPTSAAVLESFPLSFSYFSPDHPQVEYLYSYRGIDQLSVGLLYNQMISDPSDESPAIFCDPWLTYTVTISFPGGLNPNVMTEYGAYFTSVLIYRSVYDGLSQDQLTGSLGVWEDPTLAGEIPLIYVSPPWGSAGISDVYRDAGKLGVPCTFSGSTITCVAHGLNVGDAITFENTNGGVAINTTYYVINVTANSFYISENPLFLQYALNADNTNTAFAFTGTGSNVWDSATAELQCDTATLPQYVETDHDYSDSVRYAIVADNRVYAACLTWNNTTGVWNRPMQMEVSNLGDFASFPTTPDPDDLAIDGEELGGFSPDSSVIRGILVKDDLKYVWTDLGFYELVGADASQGWQFLRRDKIPLQDGKSAVDCRSVIVWASGGSRGHFYGYRGALAEPLNVDMVDFSLIDWTKAHGFICSGEKFIGFVYYNHPDVAAGLLPSAWCLLTYDLLTGAWQRRHSTAYQLAGLCCGDPTSTVYGLTQSGDIVNLFGSTGTGADYPNSSPTWILATQFIETPDAKEHRTRYLRVKAEAPSGGTLSVTVNSRGTNNGTYGSTLTLQSSQENYTRPGSPNDLPVNLIGDAFQIILEYTGVTPPTIYPHLGLELDDEVFEA